MDNHPELRNKTWSWYHPSFDDKLSPEGRKLLEDCGVKPEDVNSHVYRVRDEAWEVYPFPCVGMFWFLEFGITHHPRMQDIVSLLREPPPPLPAGSTHSPPIGYDVNPVIQSIFKAPAARRLLDLGTCVGQDLRALRAAGAPSETLYGSDLFPGFEAVGHAMFLDKSTFSNRVFVADILDDDAQTPFKLTAGHWDVVTTTMFFHLFDMQVGQEVANRVIPLLKHVPGSMIVGNNTGETVFREIPMREPFTKEAKSTAAARHSRESMQAMWEKAIDVNEPDKDVATRSSRWSVWSDYDQNFTARLEKEKKEKAEPARFYTGAVQRRVMFCVRRL